MIASRRRMPASSDHFAKSTSRIAFFATMPISRITPMRLIRLSVVLVASIASMTPMSDSGSDSMIASGSRNEPNCTTSTKYISSTARPSAAKICPNTCGLILALAALPQRVARRQVHLGGHAGVDVLQHFGERAALRVGLDGDRPLAIEVVDARRARHLW